MLDKNGFDLWSDEYDKTVGVSDSDNTYPFAGYKEVLDRIFKTVTSTPNAVILDIGFGTGVLSAKLYALGYEIWGQDFSQNMLDKAKSKMPDAHLYLGDFANGLDSEILHNKYDYIVATYSLHHLKDEGKIKLINLLLTLLKPEGKILIGDVAFETTEKQNACRINAGDEWDDEEYYTVFDNVKSSFDNVEFQEISHCAGLITVCGQPVDKRRKKLLR